MAIHSRPTAGSWVRAAVYGRFDQKEFSNDFWFSITAGVLDPSLDGDQIGSDIYAALNVVWKPCITLELSLLGIDTEINDGAYSVTTAHYDRQDGTNASEDALPEQDAVVIQKVTSHPGRTGRGRWFFCGVGEDDTLSSYLTPAGLVLWQAFAVGLKTAVSGLNSAGAAYTLSPAHFSPQTGVLYPIHNTPVVALIGSKRRRKFRF